LVGQLLVRLGRRHHLFLIGGEDTFDELAFVRLAGDEGFLFEDGGAVVEAELGLALVLVRTVTGEAVVGEDRADVAVVAELRSTVCGPGWDGGARDNKRYRSEKT